MNEVIELRIPKELNLINFEPLNTINNLRKRISDIEKDINQNYINVFKENILEKIKENNLNKSLKALSEIVNFNELSKIDEELKSIEIKNTNSLIETIKKFLEKGYSLNTITFYLLFVSKNSKKIPSMFYQKKAKEFFVSVNPDFFNQYLSYTLKDIKCPVCKKNLKIKWFFLRKAINGVMSTYNYYNRNNNFPILKCENNKCKFNEFILLGIEILNNGVIFNIDEFDKLCFSDEKIKNQIKKQNLLFSYMLKENPQKELAKKTFNELMSLSFENELKDTNFFAERIKFIFYNDENDFKIVDSENLFRLKRGYIKKIGDINYIINKENLKEYSNYKYLYYFQKWEYEDSIKFEFISPAIAKRKQRLDKQNRQEKDYLIITDYRFIKIIPQNFNNFRKHKKYKDYFILRKIALKKEQKDNLIKELSPYQLDNNLFYFNKKSQEIVMDFTATDDDDFWY